MLLVGLGYKYRQGLSKDRACTRGGDGDDLNMTITLMEVGIRRGTAPQMITVLLLDDDQDFFATIRRHLAQACDITVDSVTLAGEALSALRLRGRDVVVTTYGTASQEGPALIAGLGKRYPLIPLVIITDRSGDHEEIAALYPGVVRCQKRPGKADHRFLLELAEAIRIAAQEEPESLGGAYEQDLLAQIMETSTAGILVVDQEGAVTFANRAAEELLEIRPHDFRKGSGLLSGFPFKAPISAGAQVKDQHYTVGEGEQERVFLINGTPLTTGAGGRRQMVVVVEDVTETVQLEEALIISEERYRLIADNMEDLVWMMNPDHSILFASPSMERALGYSLEELQRMHLEDCLTQQYLRPMKKAIDGSLNEWKKKRKPSTSATIDLEFRRKDGSTAWAEVQLTLIRSAEGQLAGTLGVGRDVSARRRAELALRESEERFRLLAENSTDMIARHALDSTFWYVSPVCTPLLGYTQEALIGRSCFAFIHPNDLEAVQQACTDMLASPDVILISYRFRRLDGTYIWFETTARTIWDAATDQPIEIHTSSRDITERKQFEGAIAAQTEELKQYSTALAQANQKLNLLNSVTRHDIQNQLTVISGYLEMMEADITDPVLLRYLRRQQHAVELIHHQIEFTKAYQDLGAEAPKWQNAAECLSSAISSLEMEGIVLDVDLEGLEIYADPLLEKVFFNLVENGIRHGEKITRIRFWYEEAGGEVMLFYQDDGTGIPKAQKEPVFERGYGTNTGLGLFLIREILSITGIRIKETGEEGSGARFMITIPAGGYRIQRAPEQG